MFSSGIYQLPLGFAPKFQEIVIQLLTRNWWLRNIILGFYDYLLIVPTLVSFSASLISTFINAIFNLSLWNIGMALIVFGIS